MKSTKHKNKLKVLPSKILFNKAYGKFCIPAINVSNPEQVISLFKVAEKLQAPFIVQTTPAAREYIPPKMLLGYIKSAIDLHPNNVCAIHIDHGYESHIIDGINSGIYTSVMIDASHDPIEKNIQRTKLIVDKAHKKNISVEAELGILSGQEDDIDVDEQEAKFTNPEDVEYFVQKTNCDSLAVAVGTSHGAYKFSGGGKLRLDILRKIQERLPRFPIVLHGASTIDKNEVDRINNAGGSLKNNAKGVSESDIKEAIKLGVCKINIATDLRLLWTRIFREFFRDSSGEWDHLKPGKKYMEELEILLEKKFKLLLCVEKNNLF